MDAAHSSGDESMTMVAHRIDARRPGADGPLGPGVERVHLVGIGGAGMEGLARLLGAMGYRVTGSDVSEGPVIEDLRRSGIAVFHGHDAAHTRAADLLIHSAAIPESNPERQAASSAGIRQFRRAAALGLLSRGYDTVAVAGTHGKTTTASLIAAALHGAGRQPTIAVGGWVNGQTQSAAGAGNLMVVEADEYDRSFLELEPWLAVVTNIEMEHVDCYADEAELLEAFVAFLGRTRADGCVIINGDDPLCTQVLERVRGLDDFRTSRVITFGFTDGCDVRASDLHKAAGGISFDCEDAKGSRRLSLRIPGRHNVANALAACTAARALGLDPGAVGVALAGFAGVDRRFQQRGQFGGVQVVDDYAHHPTEVAATLAAARQQMGHSRRLVAVLQPHTYTRTKRFHADFSRVLAAADSAWVTAVYAAREEPGDGVQSDVIVSELQARGADAHWEADVDHALRAALDSCDVGDWLVVMGAGDIGVRLDALLVERGA
jgi:UDP-N-acetylmuramate--alanine ligase